MRIDIDEDYDKAVENYILDNEEILREIYWHRAKEEWRIEFANLTKEEKINFLY